MLANTRIVCGLIASLHFLFLLWTGNDWFGATGWFDVEAGRYLIGHTIEGTGSFYRWSFLYGTPEAVSAMAGIGLLAGLAMAAGLGARISPMLAWFCATTFHHRAPLLTQVYEPLLVSLLAYLMIDTGRLRWTFRPGWSDGNTRIGANIVSQLIRIHLWIWIAFSLACMLSNSIWWNGEAGWLLIREGRGGLRLDGNWQWLGQLLTHLVVLSHVAILFCMLHNSSLWLGRWVFYVLILAMLLLLGDWMYASVLLAASLIVWPIRPPHVITDAEQP
jgi:hypothetical protein